MHEIILHYSARQRQLQSLPTDDKTLFEIDVLGDGNCMFYAVVYAYLFPVIKDEAKFLQRYANLFGEGRHHDALLVLNVLQQYDGNPNFFHEGPDAAAQSAKDLIHLPFRLRVVDYIIQHPVDPNFIPPEFDHDFETYLNYIIQPKAWGGPIELLAISNMLQVHIQIFNVVDNQLVKVNEEYGLDYAETIRLVHHNSNHYHFLFQADTFLPLIQEGPQLDAFSLEDISRQLALEYVRKVNAEEEANGNAAAADPVEYFYQFIQPALHHFNYHPNAIETYLPKDHVLPSDQVMHQIGRYLNNVALALITKEKNHLNVTLAYHLFWMSYLYLQTDATLTTCISNLKQSKADIAQLAKNSRQLPHVNQDVLMLQTLSFQLEAMQPSIKDKAKKLGSIFIETNALSRLDKLIHHHSTLFTLESNSRLDRDAAFYRSSRLTIEREIEQLSRKVMQ